MPLTHLAIAFVLAHPGVTSALIGPRTMAHLDDLLAGVEVALDDDLLDRIDKIVPPGTDVGTLDMAYQPAIERAELRRRPQVTASPPRGPDAEVRGITLSSGRRRPSRR